MSGTVTSPLIHEQREVPKIRSLMNFVSCTISFFYSQLRWSCTQKNDLRHLMFFNQAQFLCTTVQSCSKLSQRTASPRNSVTQFSAAFECFQTIFFTSLSKVLRKTFWTLIRDSSHETLAWVKYHAGEATVSPGGLLSMLFNDLWLKLAMIA